MIPWCSLRQTDDDVVSMTTGNLWAPILTLQQWWNSSNNWQGGETGKTGLNSRRAVYFALPLDGDSKNSWDLKPGSTVYERFFWDFSSDLWPLDGVIVLACKGIKQAGRPPESRQFRLPASLLCLMLHHCSSVIDRSVIPILSLFPLVLCLLILSLSPLSILGHNNKQFQLCGVVENQGKD